MSRRRDRDAEQAMVDAWAPRVGAIARSLVSDDETDAYIGQEILDWMMVAGACPYYHGHGEISGWVVRVESEWRAMMPTRALPDEATLRSWLHRLPVVDVLRAVAITSVASSRRGDDFAADRYWFGVCTGIERER